MKLASIFLASFCLAPSFTFAADVADVRVVVNGRTYSGQLAPEPLPTTQPTTLPTSQPTTMPVTTAPVPAPTTKPIKVSPPASVSGIAPFQVHLDAVDVVAPEAVRNSRVHWDFGDAAGRYNALDGFNAAHVYDVAGSYTIVRTTVSLSGDSVKRWTVSVAPSTRRVTYVSLAGDDRNDGKTPEHAVRTFDRGVLGTNAGAGDVLFRRGDQFQVTRSLALRYDDCRLGAFGAPNLPRPILFNIGTTNMASMIDAGGKRLIVEDLVFDAPKAKPGDKPGTLDVVTARGTGLVVRRCTVLDVDDLVNGNGNPSGVLIEDCDAPLDTGLRAYFAWVQGTDWTIVGNHVANSTREHIIRVGGAQRLNIQFNEFTNLDRTHATTQPDSIDVAKGVLNVQKGDTLYAANNTLTGPSGVGPLGQQDGLKDKPGRFVGAVLEHNRINGILEVKHGASHITYRDNLMTSNNRVAFALDGFNKEYGRGVVDVRIEHNTVTNSGKIGGFMTLWAGAKEISLVGNAYLAPILEVGANDSAVLSVSEPDQRAFTMIAGNVWPVAKPSAFAHNGLHYFAWKVGDPSGYLTPATWSKLPLVVGDRFESIRVADWQNVKDAGVNINALPAEVKSQAKESTR